MAVAVVVLAVVRERCRLRAGERGREGERDASLPEGMAWESESLSRWQAARHCLPRARRVELA